MYDLFKIIFLKINKNDFFSDSKIGSKISAENFDQVFFEENLSRIFFRLLVVVSYLQIDEIKNCSSFAGSGFADFTSIISILHSDQKKLLTLFEKNRQKIQSFFDEIS